jgi:lambda repressor-like predicted transcriptional regulator
MKSKQIIRILSSCTDALSTQRASRLLEGLQFSDQENRAFIRRDLRSEISARIKEEGLSVRQVAISCGAEYSNFTNYLKGNRPLPDKYLERVLALLKL